MFQFSGFAPRLSVVLRLHRSGLPHSEINGYIGYLLLPVAYRSLSRPSSPLRAKAFTMRSYLLSKVFYNFINSHSNTSKNFIGVPLNLLKETFLPPFRGLGGEPLYH